MARVSDLTIKFMTPDPAPHRHLTLFLKYLLRKHFSSSQRWRKAVFQQQKCWQDDGVQCWPRVECTKITFSANTDKLRFASV